MYSSSKPSLKDTTLIMYQKRINQVQTAVNLLAGANLKHLPEFKTLSQRLEYFEQSKKDYLNNIK